MPSRARWSAAAVGDEVAVDGVAEAPLDGAHRVFATVTLGLFALVVVASGCVVADLVTAIMWMAWLSWRLPRGLRRCRITAPLEASIGSVA